MVLVFVARVVGGQMPFVLVYCVGDRDGHHAVLLIRVFNVRLVQDCSVRVRIGCWAAWSARRSEKHIQPSKASWSSVPG